jgi:hypothetical protein
MAMISRLENELLPSRDYLPQLLKHATCGREQGVSRVSTDHVVGKTETANEWSAFSGHATCGRQPGVLKVSTNRVVGCTVTANEGSAILG